MRSVIFSHKGTRENNQDYTLVDALENKNQLFLVVDGMGGYDYGESAAKLVADSMLTYLMRVDKINAQEIQKGINKANLAIRQFNEDKQTKSGATVGGIIIMPKQTIGFWVGDVKIMHFRDKILNTESSPHTLMNQIIKHGSIRDPDQATKYRHVVTRSVQGDTEKSIVDIIYLPSISPSDLFVICSDGVHDLIDSLQIQQNLKSLGTIEETLAQIEERLSREAKDNFSLIGVFV